MPDISLDFHDRIAILTVNRPQVRNALNLQAMADFASAIERAYTVPDLAALIVTGAGKSFVSGGDINELSNYPAEADAARMTARMADALERLAELPGITLAAMEGPARGGGCEVALACDWRVAAEDADMGYVQIRLGLTTGWGGAVRLARMVGHARALDLLALGRVLTAPEAHRLGIVTHLCQPGAALNTALQIAGAVAQFDTAAVRAYKRIVRAAGSLPMDEAQAVERAEFPKLWVGEAHRRAEDAFLKRESASNGGADTSRANKPGY